MPTGRLRALAVAYGMYAIHERDTSGQLVSVMVPLCDYSELVLVVMPRHRNPDVVHTSYFGQEAISYSALEQQTLPCLDLLCYDI